MNSPVITDEAFRLLYSSKVDFAHLEKYDLQGLTTALTQKINLRFGNEIIKEVLVEEFTYVPKRDISRQALLLQIVIFNTMRLWQNYFFEVSPAFALESFAHRAPSMLDDVWLPNQ